MCFAFCRGSVLGGLFLLWVGLAGCSSSDDIQARRFACASNDDCSAGEVCVVGGVCAKFDEITEEPSPVPSPVGEPAGQPVGQPVGEPVKEPVEEPVQEPVAEPGVQPEPSAPTPEPAPAPLAEPSGEPEPTVVSMCEVDGDCSGSSACVAARCMEGMCVEEMAPERAPCDDQNPCTQDDSCTDAGVCLGAPVFCDTPPDPFCNEEDSVYVSYSAVGQCDPGLGECVYEEVALECDSCEERCLGACDTLVCQTPVGSCQLGVCIPSPLPATCEFRNAPAGQTCANDALEEGHCNHAGECVECTEDTGCDEEIICAVSSCRDGACVQESESDGTPCDFAANRTGYCADGACAECIENDHCDDGNVCTRNRCENGACVVVEKSQCTLPEGIPGICVQGDCVECLNAGQCNDGDPCTLDECVNRACTNRAFLAENMGIVSCDGGYCDRGACVSCVDDSHCDGGDACRWESCEEGTCVQNDAALGASCFLDGANVVGYCRQGTCIECASNADCQASVDGCIEETCNVATNQCERANTDGNDCVLSSGEEGYCSFSMCRKCTIANEDEDCAAPTPYCREFLCRECRSPVDCPLISECMRAICGGATDYACVYVPVSNNSNTPCGMGGVCVDGNCAR